MDYLNALETMLKAYPGWGGLTLQIDSTGPETVSCGLFPQGEEILSSWENVTGVKRMRLRQKFILRRICPRGATENAWIRGLQAWLTGKKPDKRCTFRAENGRLVKAHPTGCDVYELTITAEYTKETEYEQN